VRRDFVDFSRNGSEALRPAQFLVISALPLGGVERMVEGRIRDVLQREVVVDAYEIRLSLAPATCRRPVVENFTDRPDIWELRR
jgi:hypothetical protein